MSLSKCLTLEPYGQCHSIHVQDDTDATGLETTLGEASAGNMQIDALK